MEETKQTSEYRIIPDGIGVKTLEAMERNPRGWEDTLKKARITNDDFANWLQGSQEYKDRFAVIRNKGDQQ